jgi:superfamily II RNA helicase
MQERLWDMEQEMENNQTIRDDDDNGSADFFLQDDIMARQEQQQQQPAVDAPNDRRATQAEQEERDCDDIQKIIDEELELQYASAAAAVVVERQEMHQESSVWDLDNGGIDQAFGFAMAPSHQATFPDSTGNAQEASNGSETCSSDDEQGVGAYRDGIDTDERVSEVHPSLYVPPPYQHQPQPLVHFFSQSNRPMASRQCAPIAQLFQPRVACFWKGKFDHFNHLQSEVANTLAHSDDNVVVSAPTGAGKTAVFEMAMARFFAMDLQAASSSSRMGNSMHHHSSNNNVRISRNRKIVYVAPSKALVEERYEDWSKRLSAMRLGIEIVVVTGDGDPGESFRDIMSAHVILTTPEVRHALL